MKRRSIAILIACALVGAPALLPGASAQTTLGSFSAPFAEDPTFDSRPPANGTEAKITPPAVSVSVLPDGRILYFGGLTGLEDGSSVTFDAGRAGKPSPARVLDLRDFAQGNTTRPTWFTPTPETGGADDMFCADIRNTADGRVIVAGGTIWRSDPIDLTPVTGPGGPGGTAEVFGSNAARIFDPATNTWVHPVDNLDQTLRMKNGRWYPTMVTLPDGDIFVGGGVERLVYNTKLQNVLETETFDLQTQTWSLNDPATANTTLPLFARMHLTHDGKVLYSATGQMYSPAGESYDEALWTLHKAYDPATKSWSMTGLPAFLSSRSSAFSVVLPFKPPYNETNILIGGGTFGPTPSTYVAHNLTEIVTYKDGQSSAVRGPDLNNRRWFSSGVLLPDGGVLALSGGDKDEVIQPASEVAVRQAELFDGEKWVPLASGSRDRTYHNSAVLLPDATVLVGGHSPIANGYGTYDNTLHDNVGTAANFKDPSFEILRPPYLDAAGARPVIDYAPAGIDWGTSFVIGSLQAGDVDRAVLVKLPSTTHATDADMRAVDLTTSVVTSGVLSAAAPPSGAIAPPGYYYLFLISKTGKPSKARIVKVGTENLLPAPAPFGA